MAKGAVIPGIGWAYAERPAGGQDFYRVLATKPGELLLLHAGHRDTDGSWTPGSRILGTHGTWVPRRGYGLQLDEHWPRFGEASGNGGPERQRLHVMSCGCGVVKRAYTRALAQLEFETHTSHL